MQDNACSFGDIDKGAIASQHIEICWSFFTFDKQGIKFPNFGIVWYMIEHKCCTCSDFRPYSYRFMMILKDLCILLTCNISRIRDEFIAYLAVTFNSSEWPVEYFLHSILCYEFLFTDRQIVLFLLKLRKQITHNDWFRTIFW